MTLIELGEHLGLDRSFLHKRVRRDHVATISIPYRTKGGVQMVTESYAKELTQLYEQAERNAQIDWNGTETTLDRDELIELLANEYREELETDIDARVEDYESELGAMDDEELATEYEERTGGQIRLEVEEKEEE